MKAMRTEATRCPICGEHPVWWMAWDGDSRLACSCTYPETVAWLNASAQRVLSPSPAAQETRDASDG